jgi:hypothetical protein
MLRLRDKGIRMRCARGLLATSVVGLAMALAGSAAAYQTLFLGQSVVFDNGVDTSGIVTFVGIATGTPAGAYGTVGTIGGGDTALLFTVTVDSGSLSLDQVGIGALFCDPAFTYDGLPSTECTGGFSTRTTTGAGAVTGAGENVTSVTGLASTRLFNFSTLDANETSDQFFTTYAPGDIVFDGRIALNFMFSRTIAGDYNDTYYLVPEPTTGLMLGLGLIGIAYAGRRRR